jgi:hypothetical protein
MIILLLFEKKQKVIHNVSVFLGIPQKCTISSNVTSFLLNAEYIPK